MRDKHRDFFQEAATITLIATCLVLPVVTSLLSVFSILTLVLWGLSGKYRELPALLRSNLIVMFAMALFVLFVLGTFYSSADFSDTIGSLKKYRELIFIPVVISLLHSNPLAKTRCETGFLVGCIILMLSSYCMYFSIIPAAKFGNSFLFHITHNFFMSILAYFAANKTIDSRENKIKVFWLFVFLLSILNMFYIAPGRTGMLVFLFLMILFFLQRLSLIKLLFSIAIFSLMLSMVFVTSDNLSERTGEALHEIQIYEYGASRTSLGMRFDWWLDSLALMKMNPILGHGTGSFITEHDKFIEGSKIMRTDNPHNEYLLIGVQLGIVGLAAFIALLVTQFTYSLKLNKPDKLHVQGVVVAMVVGCIMNSFLFDSHQGHFWAILSAIYFSSSPDLRENKQSIDLLH